jgi:hypothetical protein
VLYPRKAGEARPGYETIAGGAGVKVITPRGTDWVFLAAAPVKWEGDGIAFEGRAGAIRRTGDHWEEVVFAEPGSAAVAGQRVVAAEPMERALKP